MESLIESHVEPNDIDSTNSFDLPDHLEIEDIKEDKGFNILEDELTEQEQTLNEPKKDGMELEEALLVNQETEWEELDRVSAMRPEEFIRPKIVWRDPLSPFEIFQTIIGRTLIDHLVYHTNKYAQDYLEEEETKVYL